MSGGGSEEKSLPASEKKIREAREKGRLAHSRDVTSAVVLTFVGLYVLSAWAFIADQFGQIFEVAGRASLSPDFRTSMKALEAAWQALAAVLMPIMILTILGVILGAIISNRGFIFSITPITPDINKINPVEGFKRVFSLRNFIEFLKSLGKTILLSIIVIGLSWWGIKTAMRTPFCGSECVGESFRTAVYPILIAAILLFIFSALADIGLQNWLFARDMRMTHSEMKRERKDMHGDPILRGERNRIRQEMANEGGMKRTLKSQDPTLIITGENGNAIAFRYVRGETPAPVVLKKASGSAGNVLMNDSIAKGAVVAHEPEIAALLMRRARPDSFAPESMFKEIAQILNTYGAIR